MPTASSKPPTIPPRIERLLLVPLVAAGCASFDGHTLVPGKSTATEVEALMGAPAEVIAGPDGGRTFYYPRLPMGRQTFAVRVGRDGVLQSIEQRLTRENFAKLVAGTTTAKEVRELLGPSHQMVRYERRQRDVWEYTYRHYEEYRVLWVYFSYDGVVQEMEDMKDWSAYPPSGRGRARS